MKYDYDSGPFEPPSKEYYLNNYGVCDKTPCSCLKTGWVGILCRYWNPYSEEELIQRQLIPSYDVSERAD
jgi:hypothetical protein